MNRRFLLVAFVSGLGLGALSAVAQESTAEAGRYRFGGSGRVHVRVPGSWSGGVNVRFSNPARPAYRYYRPYSRWSTGGSIYVGGYYPRYRYYRPYYYYYYQPVPSYYGYENGYYPVQPAAPVAGPSTVAVAAPARPQLPRFGIGLFAGGVSVEDRDESSDIGLLARFRLTPGLIIQGEIAKQSYEDDLRVDRRLGASLVYEIGAYNKLAPYILAGLGVQQADVGGGEFTTTQNFGELGIGLRLALSPHFHILGDIRAGSRATVSENSDLPSNSAARVINPPTADSGESEEYTRASLSAVLYF